MNQTLILAQYKTWRLQVNLCRCLHHQAGKYLALTQLRILEKYARFSGADISYKLTMKYVNGH